MWKRTLLMFGASKLMKTPFTTRNIARKGAKISLRLHKIRMALNTNLLSEIRNITRQ